MSRATAVAVLQGCSNAKTALYQRDIPKDMCVNRFITGYTQKTIGS